MNKLKRESRNWFSFGAYINMETIISIQDE
uniref:Uncharacterized protein n=1 Tax=Myoviridae sp. ctgsk7 TaxID=2825151 RepID=A0A8S5PXY3_9CAUD|nr:MAG TPA: hypothetical protein [Myoviridae sp. ctgsk7]